MRRALLFTLPLLLGGGLLAACGSDDDSDETGMGPMDNTADHMDGMEDHRESSEIAAGAPARSM